MAREIRLVTRESGALRRRLKEIQSDIAPKSPKMDRLRTSLKKAIVEDNTDKIYRQATAMAGVDRFGKPLAKPAASTVKGYERKGQVRQVLAPHGLSSRVITKFRVRWQFIGTQWRAVIGWDGIPWLIYHLQGCAKGSNPRRPNWWLPQRDIGGISPKGMAAIRGVFAAARRTVVRA
jgi:hypothetical protein